MYSLNCVYWDVDGTIADTEMSGHRKAFNLAFKHFKLDCYWDKNKYKKLLEISGGFNRINQYSKLNNLDLDTQLITNIHNKKQIFYKEIISKGELKIRDGVYRLISELNLLGIDQWIVTTSSRIGLNKLLNSYFESHKSFFKGEITFEDVSRHKPDPLAYLEAIKRSTINPSNSIVIEDSLIGLKAAKSAGLNCLVTLSPWTNFNKLSYSEANAVVDKLGEPNQYITVHKGPKPHKGMVDSSYLKQLINIS
tara:strand:- start:3305 stop:4057 length:753 start_codon:yes stop_codon:yes gene_type:complete